MVATDRHIFDEPCDEFSEPFHSETPFGNLQRTYEPAPQCELSFSMSAEADRQVCFERSFNNEALAVYLRRTHPNNTAAHVSSKISVPLGTVQNWIDRKSSPNVDSFIRLILAYGPECLRCASSAPIPWLDQTILFERNEALKNQSLKNLIKAGEIAKGLL